MVIFKISVDQNQEKNIEEFLKVQNEFRNEFFMVYLVRKWLFICNNSLKHDKVMPGKIFFTVEIIWKDTITQFCVA